VPDERNNAERKSSEPGERLSSRPEEQPRRPTYVVVALLMAWFLGMGTVQEGYVFVRLVRNPLAADELSLPAGLREVLAESVQQFAHVALPIGVAQMLLGGVMVLVCAATLFGARTPVNFCLQVLGANAALAIAMHVFAAPIREALIQALINSAELRTETFGADYATTFQRNPESIYQWFNRLNLAMHLGALGIASLALTRPKAKQFFASTARHEG
jgi:hypothetical protein